MLLPEIGISDPEGLSQAPGWTRVAVLGKMLSAHSAETRCQLKEKPEGNELSFYQ